MADTTIIKVDGNHSPKGKDGQKYLANGRTVSMRLWEKEAPGPGKPPLIEVGTQVQQGQAVGLIEVMKTFSRLHYGGEGLPSPARVKAILVKDEEDVAAGDALFELEA